MQLVPATGDGGPSTIRAAQGNRAASLAQSHYAVRPRVGESLAASLSSSEGTRRPGLMPPAGSGRAAQPHRGHTGSVLGPFHSQARQRRRNHVPHGGRDREPVERDLPPVPNRDLICDNQGDTANFLEEPVGALKVNEESPSTHSIIALKI